MGLPCSTARIGGGTGPSGGVGKEGMMSPMLGLKRAAGWTPTYHGNSTAGGSSTPTACHGSPAAGGGSTPPACNGHPAAGGSYPTYQPRQPCSWGGLHQPLQLQGDSSTPPAGNGQPCSWGKLHPTSCLLPLVLTLRGSLNQREPYSQWQSHCSGPPTG